MTAMLTKNASYGGRRSFSLWLRPVDSLGHGLSYYLVGIVGGILGVVMAMVPRYHAWKPGDVIGNPAIVFKFSWKVTFVFGEAIAIIGAVGSFLLM